MGDDGRGPGPRVRLPLRPVDLVVLHNPRSGRGLAGSVARAIHDRLEARGHRAKMLTVGGREILEPAKLGQAEALVLVGGDGTVNHAAQAAIETGVPLYHAPTGNENLFARALGMSRDPDRVVRAIESGPRDAVDIGLCGDRPFLITAGFGPDAGVIRRLASARTRAIGHLAYVAPLLREALRPHLPRVWVEVDGCQVIDGRRGALIVGNSREYAAHLDPCPRASLFSGRLDLVFLPAGTSITTAVWAAALWARNAHRFGALETRAAEIRVRADRDPIAQLDGELIEGGGREGLWSVRALPRELPVVLPGDSHHAGASENGQFEQANESSDKLNARNETR